MKWMRFAQCLGRRGGFVEDQPWPRPADRADGNAERHGEQRRDRMPGWIAEEHRPAEVAEKIRDLAASGDGAIGLITARKLAAHDRARP